MPRKPAGLFWKLPLLLGAAAFLGVWTAYGLPCLFRRLTGLPCPGCGMGRAWLQVLELNLPGAFACHPMFWAVPVLGVFFLYDFAPFRKERWNVLLLVGIALGVGVCYAIRLIAFLHGAPLL